MKKMLILLTAALLLIGAVPVFAEIYDLSICEFQEVPVGEDSSHYAGDTVQTSGIITAGTHLYYAGAGVSFYMQDPNCGPLFSGVMAYSPTSEGFPELFPGDSVTVVAVVSEYLDTGTGVSMTELLIVPNGFTFHSFSNPEPAPLITPASMFDSTGNADSLGEGYEGVLTAVQGITIDSVINYTTTSTWICHDTTGIVYVREASDSIDDSFRPPVGTVFSSVTGVLYHRFGLYHLQPRYMRDFVFESGAPIISGTGIFPPYPMLGDNVDFSANILDPDGQIEEAALFVRVNLGNWEQYPMDEDEPGQYLYSIPGSSFSDGDRVDYYVFAMDDEGNESKDPLMAPISFYTFTVRSPMPMTIAEATADENDDFIPDNMHIPVEISGIVTANTFGDIFTNAYVQDETGGVNIYYSLQLLDIVEGDSVTVKGVVDQYYGKTEVIFYDNTKITNHGHGYAYDTLTVTCSDLNQQVGEQLEGLLVKIPHVTLEAVPDEWPILGQSATMTIHDNGGSAALRIDHYTDIDGNMEPRSPMTIVGLVSQYDYSSPPDSNYQLQPRKYTDFTLETGIEEDGDGLPNVYKLGCNYPNPFNPTTSINYQLPMAGHVEISIYNLLGQKIKTLVDEYRQAGSYNAEWDASSCASGLYFYKMKSGDFVAVKKMTVLK